MKRVFWFSAGAASGVAGTVWTQRKLKEAAAAAKPRAVATRAAGAVRSRGADLVDALREGRLAMRQREAELRAQLDGPAEITEIVEVQATPTRRTRRTVRVRIPRR